MHLIKNTEYKRLVLTAWGVELHTT